MEKEMLDILRLFYQKSQQDCRLNKAHLALFLSLFLYWESAGFPQKINVFSNQMMPLAKISSTATYNKLIRQLDEYGYIRYMPSHYKKRGSEIAFNTKGS